MPSVVVPAQLARQAVQLACQARYLRLQLGYLPAHDARLVLRPSRVRAFVRRRGMVLFMAIRFRAFALLRVTVNFMAVRGRGFIRLDKDEISFRGEVFGQPLEFREKLSTVKALPVSVGHHFDLYHKKVLYNFILQPDPRAAVKWSLYADKVNRN